VCGSGSLRHSVEKLSFWFASFDSSHGCFLDSGSLSEGEFGLEGQRDGEVLAYCVISICNLFARKLVHSSTCHCCLAAYRASCLSGWKVMRFGFLVQLLTSPPLRGCVAWQRSLHTSNRPWQLCAYEGAPVSLPLNFLHSVFFPDSIGSSDIRSLLFGQQPHLHSKRLTLTKISSSRLDLDLFITKIMSRS
jgi:hypothetical protein